MIQNTFKFKYSSFFIISSTLSSVSWFDIKESVTVLGGNSRWDNSVSSILSNYNSIAYNNVFSFYSVDSSRGLKSLLYFSMAFILGINWRFYLRALRRSLYLKVNAWSTKNKLLFFFKVSFTLTSYDSVS